MIETIASSVLWVTLICAPQCTVIDEAECRPYLAEHTSNARLIVSFSREGNNIRDIVVINEDGSRERGRWRVSEDEGEVVIDLSSRSRVANIRSSFETAAETQLTLIYRTGIRTSHVPFFPETLYACDANTAERND